VSQNYVDDSDSSDCELRRQTANKY